MSCRSRLFVLVMIVCAVVFRAGADEAGDVAAAKAAEWKPVNAGAFADSIRHALMKNKDGKAPYPQYTESQIVHIAENVLAYQNGDGGWPKNIDWLKVLSEDELAKLPQGEKGKSAGESTLDNATTWSQVDYLARVHLQVKLARYSDAAIRGIDYLLAAQNASGGWRGADVDAITFNDDVMTGALRTLRSITHDRQTYAFVNAERRAKAKSAYDRGIQCILKCQIRVKGELTAWCQQHSHTDFQPVWARTFEPPSITASESVYVVRVLMQIDNPSEEIRKSVEAAAAWLTKAQIHGIRVDKVPAPAVDFKYQHSEYDTIEVKDPAAPAIWARYYDLETETPLFCNRERKLTKNYMDVDRERRTGYAWYGRWPAQLLETEYPAWRQRWILDRNIPKLYVIGDSTASVYPPKLSPRTGWAQVLQDSFDRSKIVVVDKAMSGRSSKSYYDEGSWAPIAEGLTDKDYVFIQFGSNDSKKEDPDRFTDPDTTYIDYLKKYIDETKAKGAHPVLVTPINRCSWESGKRLKDTLGGYPAAARKLAQELGLPLIDLDKMTRELFESLGRDAARGLFMNLEKGASPNYPDGSSDNSHLQEKGAREVCKLVMASLKELRHPLADCAPATTPKQEVKAQPAR